MSTTFLKHSINKGFIVAILLLFDDYKMTTRLQLKNRIVAM